MTVPTEDVATKVSAEVADGLMRSFYSALETSRASIASYYVPAGAMPDGKPLPAIVYNGNVFPNATAMQTMFETMGPAHYEVQSYDCQVLNPNSVVANTSDNYKAVASGKRMTLLVVVSGYVKFGEPREADMRGFSETFVLVPNPAATSGVRGKNIKEWLIQSQNFRLVV